METHTHRLPLIFAGITQPNIANIVLGEDGVIFRHEPLLTDRKDFK